MKLSAVLNAVYFELDTKRFALMALNAGKTEFLSSLSTIAFIFYLLCDYKSRCLLHHKRSSKKTVLGCFYGGICTCMLRALAVFA